MQANTHAQLLSLDARHSMKLNFAAPRAQACERAPPVAIIKQRSHKRAAAESRLNDAIGTSQNSVFGPLAGRGPPRSGEGTRTNIFGSRKKEKG